MANSFKKETINEYYDEKPLSSYSTAKNDVGARTFFVERKKYREEVFPDDTIPNMIDTWGKDSFYGVLNTRGNGVIPNSSFFKSLQYGSKNQDFYALSFVADAFRDFADKMRELATKNIIFRESPWARPEVKKAVLFVENSYNEYMIDNLFTIFTERHLARFGRDKKVKDFNTFLAEMTDFQDLVLSFGGPLSLSGYVESGFTTVLNSGLAIEIGSDNYDDDYNKSLVYGDANFQMAARIAEQYGFLIDRNIPWRLVANLGSKAMQEYMHGVPLQNVPTDNKNLEKCKMGILTGAGDIPDFFGYSEILGYEDVVRHVNTYIDVNGDVKPGYPNLLQVKDMSDTQKIFETVFDNYYFETWKFDMRNLTPYLVQFYNSIVDAFPVVSFYDQKEKCEDKRVKMIRRQKVTMQTVRPDGSHGDLWSLKAFYTIRKFERGKQKQVRMSAVDLRKVIDIYDHFQGDSYQEALKYIQETLLGPFQDKALTYYQVGDIIAPGQKLDIPDTRRQTRMRGGLY